jgi:hypothetical protein
MWDTSVIFQLAAQSKQSKIRPIWSPWTEPLRSQQHKNIVEQKLAKRFNCILKKISLACTSVFVERMYRSFTPKP